MKKKTRAAALALALVLGTGTAALAAGNLINIAVNPGMKLSIDGEAFVPTDVNGKEVDVFAYNGTTYVPIRAISQAFGKAVSYDAATQTAVIQSVTPPCDPDKVDYVLSYAPETYTDDNGNLQTWYNGVGYEFRWWLPEDQQNSFTVKQVSGQLPDGITLVGDRLEGQCLAAGEADVTFTVTPKKGEAVTRTLHFRFMEPGEFATAPVILWGKVGDTVDRAGINSFFDGVFYTKDDLTAANTQVEYAQLGSSPIGTQAGLDALAEYGLSLDYEAVENEDGYRWADKFLTGTFTQATDGWVKISIPVYATAGSSNPDFPMEENFWYANDADGNPYVVSGTVDVYLNIVGF